MKTVMDLTVEQIVEIACLADGRNIMMHDAIRYDEKLQRISMNFDYDECGGNTLYIESNLDVRVSDGEYNKTMNQFAIQERFKTWGITWS